MTHQLLLLNPSLGSQFEAKGSATPQNYDVPGQKIVPGESSRHSRARGNQTGVSSPHLPSLEAPLPPLSSRGSEAEESAVILIKSTICPAAEQFQPVVWTALEETMARTDRRRIDVKRKMFVEFENVPFHCLEAEISTPSRQGGQWLSAGAPQDAEHADSCGLRQDVQSQRQVQGA